MLGNSTFNTAQVNIPRWRGTSHLEEDITGVSVHHRVKVVRTHRSVGVLLDCNGLFVAVEPEHQRRGAGTILTQRGLGAAEGAARLSA